MSLKSIRVSVPVLMLMVFQSGNCHNSSTENGLMNLFYGRASGQRSMAPVAAPQQTVHQRDVQAPEVNTRSLRMQNSTENEQLSEQIERLNREVAELRMALPNRYPPVYGYNYPPAYGYSYPNGVNSVEFNQHVDGASSSQEASTVYVDPHTKKLQDQFIKEQQKRINGSGNHIEKELEYQIVRGLVDDAMANLSDFLEGKKNEFVDQMLLTRDRKGVADILGKVLVREMIGLERIGAELTGVSQEVEARKKEVNDLLARLHLPESISINGKDFAVSDRSFATNSRESFCEDAMKSFTKIEKGSTFPVNGKMYKSQCAISSLNLTSEEEKKIPVDIRKELNDKDGIQSDNKELWERISDSVQKRIFVYDYQGGFIVGFYEYGKSYKDLRRVFGKFEYGEPFEPLERHYQQLVERE